MMKMTDENNYNSEENKLNSEEDTETWNGIHIQITAPKGTFEKIFINAKDDDDDI